MGGGVCESVSESLMWAYEALMLGFLNSFFFFLGGGGRGGKTHVVYLICGA